MWVSKYLFRKRITHIKNKLKLNGMQIVKADKGSSIIKTFQNDYNDKLLTFFLEPVWHFVYNPTNTFQKSQEFTI